MPFQDFLRSAAPGLGGLAGGGLGFLAAGPAGIPMGAQLGAMGGGLLGNLIPASKTPFQEQAESAQLGLLQQLQQQQPFQRVDFDPIRQQELQRFSTQTVPGLAERFAGTGNIQSSAFQQALGGAGADLGTRLAALQAGHDVGQQGAQLGYRGQDLSRLGQLQSFLRGEADMTSRERAAEQQQIGQLLGLGQQAFSEAMGGQDRQSQAIRNMLSGASQTGTGQAVKLPPGLLQSLAQSAPEILALLGKLGFMVA